jgi:hypothetical protein
MRTLIALSWIALIAIFLAEHEAFVASCTDRISTSAWCMPYLSMLLDVVLVGVAVALIVYSRRRRRQISN